MLFKQLFSYALCSYHSLVKTHTHTQTPSVELLALAFPTLRGAPAAAACFKPGRSGTLEPEVEDEKEGKNGLQARVRNQGNRALKSDKRALSRST